MASVVKGNIFDNFGEDFGKYYTDETTGKIVMVYGNAEKTFECPGDFIVWINENNFSYDEKVAKQYYPTCFDAYDVGIDIY